MINLPETGQKRIVIVGGGFAGISLALQLMKQDVQVVLIDKNNFHQFQPLFYQVAMSGLEPSSIIFPFRKLFQGKSNVFIRITEVQKVDRIKKCLHTPYGPVNYDELVISIGADTNFYGNKNIEQHAIPMKSVSEALQLRNAILEDYEKALTIQDYNVRQALMDIVIVGGGPTGVEVAGALAEMKKYILPKDYHEMNCKEIDIYLIQSGDALLKGMSTESAVAAEEDLERLGVVVRKNVRVNDFDGKTVFMNDGSTINARKVIWAAGIKGNPIEGLSEHHFVRGGRIKVNRFNQLEDDPNIYAIGDIAYMEEGKFEQGHPQVAQVAIQQGKLLSKNFKRLGKGKELIPFTYKDLGSMATIGRNRAVVDLPGYTFKGFFAWTVWLFIHLFQIIGVKNKIFVFINWVWNYFTYDQSLRLIIKTNDGEPKKKVEGLSD